MTLPNNTVTLIRVLNCVDPEEDGHQLRLDDICEAAGITRKELKRLCTDEAYLNEHMNLDLVLRFGQARGENVWLTLFFNHLISEDTYRSYHYDDHDFWVGILPDLSHYTFEELTDAYDNAEANDAEMAHESD